MSEQITIQKKIYGLQSFNDVVDTKFSQLIKTGGKIIPTKPDMTVSEFFQEYDMLFYEIPPSGSNSHLDLATRSLEYLDVSLDDLQNEINELREENVDLKTQILLSSQINIRTQI